MTRVRLFILGACAVAIGGSAWAGIPASYGPISVKAPFSFSERRFDLSVAIQLAKAEKKPLFIYLGADDCPPCRIYERFLKENRAELRDLFEKVVVVDIQTWLRGADLVFQIGERSYTLDQFKALIGDRETRLTYPYFWLITPELKQIRQLPRGVDNYLKLQNHRLLLHLDAE